MIWGDVGWMTADGEGDGRESKELHSLVVGCPNGSLCRGHAHCLQAHVSALQPAIASRADHRVSSPSRLSHSGSQSHSATARLDLLSVRMPLPAIHPRSRSDPGRSPSSVQDHDLDSTKCTISYLAFTGILHAKRGQTVLHMEFVNQLTRAGPTLTVQ